MNLFTKMRQKVNSVLFSVNKSQFLPPPFLYNAAIAITRVAPPANLQACCKKSRPLLQKAAAGSYEVFLGSKAPHLLVRRDHEPFVLVTGAAWLLLRR